MDLSKGIAVCHLLSFYFPFLFFLLFFYFLWPQWLFLFISHLSSWDLLVCPHWDPLVFPLWDIFLTLGETLYILQEV